MKALFATVLMAILLCSPLTAFTEIKYCTKTIKLRGATKDESFTGAMQCREGVVYTGNYRGLYRPTGLSLTWNKKTGTPQYCHCLKDGTLVLE